MNLRLAAKAKSRTFLASKIQVFVCLLRCDSFSFASSGVITNFGVLDCLASAKPLDPLRFEHFVWILQFAGRSDDHVGRRGDANGVVAQFQRELATPEKLFVLPALVIGVGNDARIPLGNFVDVVLVFLEELVSAASRNDFRVDNVVAVANVDLGRLAWCQRLVQVQSHHGLDDRVFDRSIVGIRHRLDFVAAFKNAACENRIHRLKGDLGCQRRSGSGGDRVRIGLKVVLVQLNPEIAKRVRRLIVVVDPNDSRRFFGSRRRV